MNHIGSRLFVWLSLISLLVNNLFVVASSFVVKASDTTLEQTKGDVKEEDNKLLQFTSSGSIIGFKNDGVIVAAKDKMVSFNFVNGNNIVP